MCMYSCTVFLMIYIYLVCMRIGVCTGCIILYPPLHTYMYTPPPPPIHTHTHTHTHTHRLGQITDLPAVLSALSEALDPSASSEEVEGDGGEEGEGVYSVTDTQIT